MIKPNCAIIKAVHKKDSYYGIKYELIGKKILYRTMEISNNIKEKGYKVIEGKVIGMGNKYNINHFYFWAIKIETIKADSCKTCKQRLQCITEGE